MGSNVQLPNLNFELTRNAPRFPSKLGVQDWTFGVSASRAFTLVELLVVMAILGLVSVFLAPALKGTLDGINLTGAAETVSGQLSVARQTAISRSLPVEVRLYQYNYNGNGLAYCVMALVIPSSVSGKAFDEWVVPGKVLSGGTVVDPGVSSSGDAFSTLLLTGTNQPPTTSSPNPSGPWPAQESTGAPGILKSLKYVAFRFLPDGSTDLPPGSTASPSPWCLSLKNPFALAATNKQTPAANYVCIVLDPLTGGTLMFRP